MWPFGETVPPWKRCFLLHLSSKNLYPAHLTSLPFICQPFVLSSSVCVWVYFRVHVRAHVCVNPTVRRLPGNHFATVCSASAQMANWALRHVTSLPLGTEPISTDQTPQPPPPQTSQSHPRWVQLRGSEGIVSKVGREMESLVTTDTTPGRWLIYILSTSLGDLACVWFSSLRFAD